MSLHPLDSSDKPKPNHQSFEYKISYHSVNALYCIIFMSANAFLSAIEDRRSLYQLADKSPISDERIHEIVAFAIRHTPSPFNVQSARVVILLRTQHEKLWDFALKVVKDEMPPTVHPVLESKVSALRAGYGTVGAPLFSFPGLIGFRLSGSKTKLVWKF